jgi:hypothetical protein
MSIAPTQDDVMTALGSFMLDRLPAGVDVVQGVVNRVAEPAEPNFAVMTLIRANRIETNVDTNQDVRFTGTIAPAVADFTASIDPAPGQPGVMPSGIMTVTAVSAGSIAIGSLVAGGGVLGATFVTGQESGSAGGPGLYTVSVAQEVLSGVLTAAYGLLTVSANAFGPIVVGANVFGTGVATGTTVRQFGTGTGGNGTYIVSPSQAVGPVTMSAGGKTIRQNSVFTVQLDFHSGDSTTAVDMAQTIATAFRDPYAVDFFAGLSGGTISPLFADDPRFAPFFNENQQAEFRWILEANLQVNQTIRVPQEFADFASVQIISVDATYPP